MDNPGFAQKYASIFLSAHQTVGVTDSTASVTRDSNFHQRKDHHGGYRKTGGICGIATGIV